MRKAQPSSRHWSVLGKIATVCSIIGLGLGVASFHRPSSLGPVIQSTSSSQSGIVNAANIGSIIASNVVIYPPLEAIRLGAGSPNQSATQTTATVSPMLKLRPDPEASTASMNRSDVILVRETTSHERPAYEKEMPSWYRHDEGMVSNEGSHSPTNRPSGSRQPALLSPGADAIADLAGASETRHLLDDPKGGSTKDVKLLRSTRVSVKELRSGYAFIVWTNLPSEGGESFDGWINQYLLKAESP